MSQTLPPRSPNRSPVAAVAAAKRSARPLTFDQRFALASRVSRLERAIIDMSGRCNVSHYMTGVTASNTSPEGTARHERYLRDAVRQGRALRRLIAALAGAVNNWLYEGQLPSSAAGPQIPGGGR